MSLLRIVLDTNVLISTLVFQSGTLSWLRKAWRRNAIRPLASRETTNELLQVLRYPKFGLSANERKKLLADYLPRCETVVVSDPPEVPECRDPSDRPFLELALIAQADALVTGDNDLIALATDFSIPILTPREFHERLTSVKKEEPYSQNED